MFGTLIDIDTDGNIFIHDKGVALLPKLFKVYKDKYLGSNAVKWIVAMYDYKSPYRALPSGQRESVINSVLLDKENCPFKNKDIVKEAIEEYRKLNYDADFEEYRSMVDKSADTIKIFKEMKVTKETLSEVNKAQEDMAKAAKSRRDMRDAIKKDIESGNKIAGLNGDDDLSLFEQEEMFK